ncbi:unnamed protein product [Rhizoctonia solani]|uniref:Uncharacterized protein n=1 Tax=Rhizoctonia solani TaxID=456999 RepID=A0A8H3DPJ1_9AGAM|nr:unnamed protein product [Rhizoctonia solani]
MGGLLTAEVALAAPPGRVIGLVSFDVPYLGVHPRVILSGIASLFKKEDEMRAYQTNSTADPHEIINELYSQAPQCMSSRDQPESSPPVPLSTPSSASLNSITPPSLHLSIPVPPVRVIAPRVERLFQTFRLGPIPQSVHNFLHFWDKHPGVIGIKDGIVQIFEFGGCLLNPQGLIARYERLQRWGSDEQAGLYGRGWVNLWTTPVPRREMTTEGAAIRSGSSHLGLQSRLSPSPSVRSQSSLNSSSFQSSLFQTISYNPSLSTSVTSLESAHFSVEQSSLAMSPEKTQEYLPSTIPFLDDQMPPKVGEKKEGQAIRKDEKRLEKEKKAKAKKAEKERAVFLKAALKRRAQQVEGESPRNFIVLPKRGTDHHWIRVPVQGAEDEITAHCGLFFRDENPGYQQLIEDVGNIIRGFWDGEGGLRHSRTAC